MKHTDGEWEVVNEGIGSTDYYIKTKDGKKYIAGTMGLNCRNNARLIAAAPTAPHECDDPECPGNINRKKLEAFPDLLEALQRLTSAYEIYANERDFQPLYWQGARAAIAKATEETT